MPPPVPVLWFPLTVLLTTARSPRTLMPPPVLFEPPDCVLCTLFPLIVLSVTWIAPSDKMPPPEPKDGPDAEFPVTVAPMSVTLPFSTAMPPPRPWLATLLLAALTTLSLTVLLTTVTSPKRAMMPPPITVEKVLPWPPVVTLFPLTLLSISVTLARRAYTPPPQNGSVDSTRFPVTWL